MNPNHDENADTRDQKYIIQKLQGTRENEGQKKRAEKVEQKQEA